MADNNAAKRSKKDRERIRAARARFQREQPSPEQLVESGEYTPAVPRAVYFAAKEAAAALRSAREEAGLTMAEVASKSSLDKATLSRLEAGKQLNPTLETLVLYAQAIGKRLCVVLAPAGGAPGAALPKTLAHVAELITDAMAKHEVDAK